MFWLIFVRNVHLGARMQAWRRLREWSMASSITLCYIPARISIRCCLTSFTYCTFLVDSLLNYQIWRDDYRRFLIVLRAVCAGTRCWKTKNSPEIWSMKGSNCYDVMIVFWGRSDLLSIWGNCSGEHSLACD